MVHALSSRARPSVVFSFLKTLAAPLPLVPMLPLLPDAEGARGSKTCPRPQNVFPFLTLSLLLLLLPDAAGAQHVVRPPGQLPGRRNPNSHDRVRFRLARGEWIPSSCHV